MKRAILAATLGAALVFAALPAMAAPPEAKPLGTFGDWEAAWFMDNGNKVCYMASKPASTKSSQPLKGRDESYLFITHWPADNEKNAVTVSAGFSIKKGSRATITVDGKVYNLAIRGSDKATADADEEMAWMDDQDKEDELATAIAKGSSLSVKTTSGRGTVITDTYSLDGSGNAYKAISAECGY